MSVGRRVETFGGLACGRMFHNSPCYCSLGDFRGQVQISRRFPSVLKTGSTRDDFLRCDGYMGWDGGVGGTRGSEIEG